GGARASSSAEARRDLVALRGSAGGSILLCVVRIRAGAVRSISIGRQLSALYAGRLRRCAAIGLAEGPAARAHVEFLAELPAERAGAIRLSHGKHAVAFRQRRNGLAGVAPIAGVGGRTGLAARMDGGVRRRIVPGASA